MSNGYAKGALIGGVCLLAACGGRTTAPAVVPSGLEFIVPGDAIAVAAIDVAALKQTAVWARYQEDAVSALERLVAASGVDAKTSVDRILVAGDGKQVLLAAEGGFEIAAMRSAMEKAGMKREAYRGKEVWLREDRAFAMIGAGRSAAGPWAGVRQAIDREGRGEGLPAAIGTLAAAIPPGMPVWAVAASGFRFSFPDRSNWRNLNRVLGSLDSMRIWVEAGDGLALETRGECATEEGAGKLARQLKGLIGMGRLSSPAGSPELLKAFDAMVVEVSGRGVHVKARLTGEVLDMAVRAMRAGGDGP